MVLALLAPKYRLRHTILFVHIPALVTDLVRGVDAVNDSAFLKAALKIALARVQDGAIQPCLLPDIFPGILNRTLCACRHTLGFQVFQQYED